MEPNCGKKRWGSIREKPHQVKMIPQFYQIYLQQQLKETEYLTLKLLVYLLQCHKTVSIEALATLMPYPIKLESRRRNIQRFLKLDCLQIETLWFPLIEIILKEKFKPKHPLKLAIDAVVAGQKCVYDQSNLGQTSRAFGLVTHQ
jgi:hypothetical protein